MQTRSMSSAVAAASCVAVILAACGGAEAASRGRRPSAAQIKAMQEKMAYMQLEAIRFEAETAALQAEIYKSFDQNGDGKLTGGEKARYDKQMRAIQAGQAPDPFAMIQPVGKGPKPKSAVDELKKRGAKFQADLLAKQEEIFRKYDENGNGHLDGAEKAMYDKYMHDVETGKEPNPFTALAGPSSQAAAGKSDKK